MAPLETLIEDYLASALYSNPEATVVDLLDKDIEWVNGLAKAIREQWEDLEA
jgi:hypothetical protein